MFVQVSYCLNSGDLERHVLRHKPNGNSHKTQRVDIVMHRALPTVQNRNAHRHCNKFAAHCAQEISKK